MRRNALLGALWILVLGLAAALTACDGDDGNGGPSLAGDWDVELSLSSTTAGCLAANLGVNHQVTIAQSGSTVTLGGGLTGTGTFDGTRLTVSGGNVTFLYPTANSTACMVSVTFTLDVTGTETRLTGTLAGPVQYDAPTCRETCCTDCTANFTATLVRD